MPTENTTQERLNILRQVEAGRREASHPKPEKPRWGAGGSFSLDTPPPRIGHSRNLTHAELRRAAEEHEDEWRLILSRRDSEIGYERVPWPDYKSQGDLLKWMCRKSQPVEELQKTTRRLQLRWHPDKMTQILGARFVPFHIPILDARFGSHLIRVLLQDEAL